MAWTQPSFPSVLNCSSPLGTLRYQYILCIVMNKWIKWLHTHKRPVLQSCSTCTSCCAVRGVLSVGISSETFYDAWCKSAMIPLLRGSCCVVSTILGRAQPDMHQLREDRLLQGIWGEGYNRAVAGAANDNQDNDSPVTAPDDHKLPGYFPGAAFPILASGGDLDAAKVTHTAQRA